MEYDKAFFYNLDKNAGKGGILKTATKEQTT